MSISTDWFALGSLKNSARFQKIRNYTFRSKVWNLQQYTNLNGGNLIAVSQYGGSVAICPDRTKLTAMRVVEPFSIEIFTQSGKKLSSFSPEQKGTTFAMGWMNNEMLVCVTSSLYFYVYSLFGKELNCIPLKRFLDDEVIIKACKIWAEGLVILTEENSKLHGHVITELTTEDPHYESLASFELVESKYSQNTIENGEASDVEDDESEFDGGAIGDSALGVIIKEKSIEILIAYKNTLLVATSKSVVDLQISNGKHKLLSVSPSGEAVATYTSEGDLCVFPTDFSSDGFQFTIENEEKVIPTQLEWCGEDALVLNLSLSNYKSKLLIISPNREFHQIEYDGPIRILGEVDGVRILFGMGCDFIHSVPASCYSIFRIGSLEPGAILYDSYQNYQKELSSSILNVRALEDKLTLAVETCLEAAGHSFDEKTQELLLRAAEFGMKFPRYSSGNHEAFSKMCKTIRVLNSVRKAEIGIPISYSQYEALTAKVLVNRLANRNHHSIAIKLCKYLSIPHENLIMHWACAKTCSSEPDDEILNAIKNRLSKYENISFSTIASTAYRVKKHDLAIKLLQLEKFPGEQVPLLLSMGKHKLAIAKAIESGETDLIYLVLLKLMCTMGVKVFGLLNDQSFKVARNLLRSYCQIEDPDFLHGFYQFHKLYGETAANKIQESFSAKNLQEKRVYLEQARSEFMMDKVYTEDAQQTALQIHLLEAQYKLDAYLKESQFVNLSLTDTLFKAIEIGTPEMMLAAESMRKEFKISDARYWWTAIRAMSKAGRWEDLFQFSRKKSPIGYGPFVEVCMEQNDYVQACRYMDKITDSYEQVELYCRLDDFNNAIRVAAEKKNVEQLDFIMRRTTDAEIRNHCQQLIARFS